MTNADRCFVPDHFAAQINSLCDTNRYEHGTIAALPCHSAQLLIDVNDAAGQAAADRVDHFFIEKMCLRVVAGGRIRLQTVTEVAAGYKRDGASPLINCLLDAVSKPNVIFI